MASWLEETKGEAREKAEKLAGDSLSQVVADALWSYVAGHEIDTNGMHRIVVEELGTANILRKKAFVGRRLVETMEVEGSLYGLALTKRPPPWNSSPITSKSSTSDAWTGRSEMAGRYWDTTPS